jgi:hypothetical protein
MNRWILAWQGIRKSKWRDKGNVAQSLKFYMEVTAIITFVVY